MTLAYSDNIISGMAVEVEKQLPVDGALGAIKRTRSINLHGVINGLDPYCRIYRPWLIDGEPTGLRNPSLAIAVFPTESGAFDLEVAESLLPHLSLEHYMREVAWLQISPDLEDAEDSMYGGTVITGDRELQEIGTKNLSGANLPSTIIIFDDLGSKKATYLLCPDSVPPSVGLRQIREQVCRAIGKKWLCF